MIEKLRNNVLLRLKWGFLCLHMLNISIDFSESRAAYLPEDLSYNDQESIVEFIVEKVIGIENAFEEHQDDDSQDHNQSQYYKIDFMRFDNESIEKITSSEVKFKRNYYFQHQHLLDGFTQLEKPPPQV